MITLSNGHQLEYVVASGALGFDGKGWLWEKPLVNANLIDLSLFTITMRTVTAQPRPYPVSNLSWSRPWTWFPYSPVSCVRFLPDGGALNKIGLYNLGIDWWCNEVAPTIDFRKINLVSSMSGTKEELVASTMKLNRFGFRAHELNYSCPNAGTGPANTKGTIESVEAVYHVSRLPLILKLSVSQDYIAIAAGVKNFVQAISLNSVPFKMVYPEKTKSPVTKLKGPGDGGVSGRPAQKLNWEAVSRLASIPNSIPVIGPSIMESEDVLKLSIRGARAFSFGAIHLRTPGKPTAIVRELNK